MKLNATPRHYMPLPQNQSDDEESGPSKEEKAENMDSKICFDTSEALSNRIRESIAEEIDLKKLPMSPLRIVMFILSLIMCVLFVVIFVFFIPCTPSDYYGSTCHLSSRWTKVFQNMSFSSVLAVVGRDFAGRNLLIVGYTNEESGLLGLQEIDGSKEWQLPLHSPPSSCMCGVVDVNDDGFAECIVVGDNGLLTAVDVKQGISLWYLHNHSDLSMAKDISEPSVVPDYDGDNIPELIISYKLANGKDSSFLALVSGGTGRIISPLFDLPQCTGPILFHLSWAWRNETDFIFYCAGKKHGNLWILPLKEIYNAAMNKTSVLKVRNFYRIPHYIADIQFYKSNILKYQLIIVLDGENVISLKRSTRYNFKIQWEFYINHQYHARIVADGQFVQDSNQLVIIGSNVSHSMVLSLNADDGTEMWSVAFENKTVSAVGKFPMLFGDADGLLLKTNTLSFYKQELVDIKNSDNSSKEHHMLFTSLNSIDKDLISAEEEYILIQAGEPLVVKTLNVEQILYFCKGDSCKPEMFTKYPIVAIDKFDEGAYGLLIVSNTFLPANITAVATEEMIVKYFDIERVMNVSSCY